MTNLLANIFRYEVSHSEINGADKLIWNASRAQRRTRFLIASDDGLHLKI